MIVPLYCIYGADRAGCVWDVGLFHEPLTALWVLEAQRLLHPDYAYGVYDLDDPERGDIQFELEEALEHDQSYLEIIQAALTEGRAQ
jgi:hypothetical protein